MKTRYDRLNQKIDKLNAERFKIGREKERRQDELDRYVRRHKSLSFDGLETCDVEKLKRIYAYFDSRYTIEWQGGLRCDNRGMRLYFWIDDDPDYLILHLSSTSESICFGGSTSWIAKAPTLAERVEILMQVKKDVLKIIK